MMHLVCTTHKLLATTQLCVFRRCLVKETGRVYRLRKASEREPLMYFGLPKLGSLSIVFGMRPEVERRPLHVQNRIRRSHCQMLAWLIDALSESWMPLDLAMFSTTTNNNSQEIPTPKKNKICPSRGLRSGVSNNATPGGR